jgi:cell division initiation protein
MMENLEIASARDIEASLRERLDTESIAVAREAATHEEEYFDPAAPQPEDEEQALVELEQELSAEEAGTTQQMEPASEPAAPQPEPEVEEPEVEPSMATEVDAQGQTTEPPATEEPAAVEESSAAGEPAEEAEPPLSEERSSEIFFDQEEESSGEGERDSRIFRASRFLRRRE